MELLKLAGVFCVMILVLWRKKPLSWAVAAAALAVWLLFWMPARTFAAALVRGAVRWGYHSTAAGALSDYIPSKDA